MRASNNNAFRDSFTPLTGHSPFPWQGRLFDEFLSGEFRASCDVPTGLGKTSVIAIWLLALAHKISAGANLRGFPRRIIYVVNRRTVVDQATREAERLRTALATKKELEEVAAALRSLGTGFSEVPLAISTLRGEFADNAEWRIDPARPAVVIGTVDMIGSRLLFAGYGCGFKSKPLHAGFLGQDSILVHDEAHLEPAFQKLVERIEYEQRRCHDFRPVRVMELTATTRSQTSAESILTDADRVHPEVWKRLRARKGIEFVWVNDRKAIAEQIAECALKYRQTGKAILIFLRTVEDLEKVRNRLEKEKLTIQPLTGTIRGLERETMVKTSPIFGRFMPDPAAVPQYGTVYLICTSAGEVGVDISADHLICDLTPFDSMAQRFGRVNRFGNGDARIQVVCDQSGKAEDGADPFEQRCQRTIVLLRRLPQRLDALYDASPDALSLLPQRDRLSAFTPEPRILPATDILFDAWAMTTIREELPGRPPVADWLHGVAEWEPPDTYVGWRSEVEIVAGEVSEKYKPEDLLEDYPLKPHELLRDRTDRVFKQLRDLASDNSELPVWILSDFGSVRVETLGELAQGDDDAIRNRTVLLPPRAGGLSAGMLDGKAKFERGSSYDVADEWLDTDGMPRRRRVWDDNTRPSGMRLIRIIDLGTDADEIPDEVAVPRRCWRWFVRPRSADDDGSRAAVQQQELAPHLQSAGEFAAAITKRVGLEEPEATAVILAAGWHDLGKHRERWQRSIHNSEYPNLVLAKSGGKMWPAELSGYRHEFGSLLDVLKDGSHARELGELAAETQDLILHLIAAHHGRARPHFPVDEAFDPESAQASSDEAASEVPRRFARLQRKYGRWGLAYLESLLRAADGLASQERQTDTSEP